MNAQARTREKGKKDTIWQKDDSFCGTDFVKWKLLRTFARILGQTMPCLCFGVGRKPHRQSRGVFAGKQVRLPKYGSDQ